MCFQPFKTSVRIYRSFFSGGNPESEKETPEVGKEIFCIVTKYKNPNIFTFSIFSYPSTTETSIKHVDHKSINMEPKKRSKLKIILSSHQEHLLPRAGSSSGAFLLFFFYHESFTLLYFILFLFYFLF
jgi:hypothetical protein